MSSFPPDLLFVKFPNRTSPITIQPHSDHTLLQWTYTSVVPQLPPLHSKVNPAHINVQSLTSLALEFNWEFPEKKLPQRDQTSLLTSTATPPQKTRKHSLHKPYYTWRVERAIQRRREAWTSRENSSNFTSAAAYLRPQQEQQRSRRMLQTGRLSYEWKLANSAKLSPNNFLLI